MANEILQRNPTSTGNRRVFTWAGWIKFNTNSSLSNTIWYVASSGSSEFQISIVPSTGSINVNDYSSSAYQYQYVSTRTFRDVSNWFHLLVAVDTTQFREDDRIKIYVNGVLYNGSYSTETTIGGINYQTRMNTPGEINTIGRNIAGGSSYSFNGQLSDIFMVDGQALTPDVFGFNKQGKGYISAGSTQATDFRPGQWVPKTPRVIKTEINRRGGFGVNGFYLPMNDSNNFGADFHGDPNSIITLNEKLPQPRVGVATTASVGLGYTDALRADPYAANLVLALPFVSGGLSSGFGDYAPSIKGSGSAKTITTSSVSIANTAGYYGSAMLAVGPNNYVTAASSTDYNFGTSDFTIECWVYLLSQGNNGYNHYFSVSTQDTFAFKSWGSYYYLYANSGTVVQTSNAPRLNQWTHLALVRKGTTVTIFENGVAAGITTNYTSSLGATAAAQIGNSSTTATEGLNGYIQDLRVYKGVAKYTSGFDVPRPYTPVGIATWRQVPDTTANNFATLNPLVPPLTDVLTYTNGNCTVTDSNTAGGITYATFSVNSDKWYYECRLAGISGASHILGWMLSPYSTDDAVWIRSNGAKYSASTGQVVNAFPTWSDGDILMVAYDHSTRRMWAGKNGTWYSGQSTTYSQPSSGDSNWLVQFSTTSGSVSPRFQYDNVAGSKVFTANFGQNPTFSGNTTAGTFTDSNGKGLFKYQPPSGFLALCEDNLPTPAISDPGKHFKTVLYTGDGNNLPVVGIGFTPDLIWTKARSAVDNNVLVDQIRGPRNILMSNQTAAESDYSAFVSFDSNGFTKASTESVSGRNYVAWCWRAGTTSTNTNGSITSVVSVNQDAGFSIVSFTSPSSGTFTIGHGLNKTPKFIITKERGAVNNWHIWHGGIMTTSSQFLMLNSTNALGNATNVWGPNVPTSSVFGANVGSLVNATTASIAYCWAEIEGFSKFGSYVGNGNADGPFVYCGFKPALVIIKCSSDAESWYMYDSSRKSFNDGSQHSLFPNLSDIESTGWPIDFLSNGFKNRYVGATNNSGRTYIFAAFAESPFTTANAK